MEYNDLKNNLYLHSQKLLNKIENNENLFIISNCTVDGLISSTIIFSSIYNLKGNSKIRVYPLGNNDFKNFINQIKKEEQDFYIFLDFRLEQFQIIMEKLDTDRFLFLNTDLEITDQDSFVNPWIFLEKKKENAITTAGLSFLLVRNYDRNIDNLSYLPVIAAISKDQTNNENTGLTGLNNEILEVATKLNLIEQKEALTIVEIQTTLITDILKNNTVHFIKGITWNEDESYNIIQKTKIPLMNGKKIRTYDELDKKELIKIVETILEFINKKDTKIIEPNNMDKNSKNNDLSANTVIEDIKSKNYSKINKKDTNHRTSIRMKGLLFSNNYILTNEEKNSLLKNTKTFSKVLDSCIRNNKEGLGISVCLGERKDTTEEIKRQVFEQNNLLRNLCLKIFSEKWRFYDDQTIIFINGEGIIDEKNQDLFINFLKKSVSYSNRIICLRTLVTENEVYKYMIVNTPLSNIDFNEIKMKLRNYSAPEFRNITMFREIDEYTIEIDVPMMQLEDFLSNIKKILSNATISQFNY